MYCISINCFVAKQPVDPVDVPLPACVVDAVASLYDQGLQGERAEGEWVFSEALGRRVDASRAATIVVPLDVGTWRFREHPPVDFPEAS